MTTFNNAINAPIPFALAKGGTGAALTASNGGIVYSNATTFAVLAGTATASQVLLSGSSTTPAWSTATYPSTVTAGNLLYASGSNTISGLANTNNAVLSSGTGGVPAWVSLATDGKLLIGSGSGAPAGATLTAGTGITITNAANSITVTASGGGYAVVDQNSSTATLDAFTKYICDNGASLITFTLPSSPTLGDTYIIVGSTASSGGWTVAQNASQTIAFGNVNTTTGTGGSISSSVSTDCITIVATTANHFTVETVMGNPSYV